MAEGPSLSSTLYEALREPIVDYCLMHQLVHGSLERGTSSDGSLVTQVPVAALPFALPSAAFLEAAALGPLWNQLVDAIARDLDWVYATLEPTLAGDAFTRRLVAICREVHDKGLRQKAYLGIHRSDYMLHEPTDGSEAPRFLQVELNTIASSMGGHADNASRLHRFLLSRYGAGGGEMARALREHFRDDDLLAHLLENGAPRRIAAALAQAHTLYGVAEAAVLIVITDVERNFADQRALEYPLWEDHGVPMLRKTLRQVRDEGVYDEESARLRIGGVEVSVVYYRAGYAPDHYETEAEWEARTLLERSLALKCPSVAYQLVGTKKVQQALARPGAVERFLGADAGAKLRVTFAGLWGLGTEEDAELIERVKANPAGFVLKPQREGGGNNFYGKDAVAKLHELSPEERGAYILMQRIVPKPQPSALMRAGAVSLAPCISEVGFYSVFVGDGTKVFLSEPAGHLVRTKMEGVDEGGVAAGFAVISSPYLVS